MARKSAETRRDHVGAEEATFFDFARICRFGASVDFAYAR